MNLTTQRRIAAQLLKCGVHRVKFDESKLQEIKDAITKADIRGLIKDGTVMKRHEVGISGWRSRKLLVQRRKGRRKGPGSRKGTRNARLSRKSEWVKKVRVMRSFIRALKHKGVIPVQTHRMIYKKVGGGFFRSKRHIKLYIEEHELGKHHEIKKARTVEKKKA